MTKGKQSYTWVDQTIRYCIMHVSLIYIIPRYGPDFATLLKLPASPVVVVFIQLFKAKSLSSKFADFSFFSRTILASWFDVFLSFDRFLPFFYLLIVSTFWSFYLLIILPFDRSTFCHSTFCHSTLCHSTFCHSTFCRSAVKMYPTRSKWLGRKQPGSNGITRTNDKYRVFCLPGFFIITWTRQ